ncbi:unnamed protein product [Peniophora sp. CBMAI 1063]|nr:unnamed protein product [Peniophora sp. CBMAI 1063]
MAFYDNSYDVDQARKFRDDVDNKIVYLQSAGLDSEYRAGKERHAFLFWDVSKPEIPGYEVSKMVHLTGSYGKWALSIECKRRHSDYRQKNQIRALGTFSRAQRDRILTHARDVRFDKHSRVNSCRTFLRDLLVLMVEDAYLPVTQGQLDALHTAVPLLYRVAELER